MNENERMEQMEETNTNEGYETESEGGGLGLLVLAGAAALGAGVCAGARWLYDKHKNRKCKPEVVEDDVTCVNDDDFDLEEETEGK